MRKLYYTAFAAVLIFTACNNGEKKEETTTTEATAPAAPSMPPASKLGEANTQKLVAMVNDYYALKDAMVAANATMADSAAQQLQASATDLMTAVKNDTAVYASMQPYFDTIVNSSKQIPAVKDETCEVKRVHFEKVSNGVYGIVKAADLKNAGIYREYCPMAFNDKGAYWLSNDPEIKNPYFGKKMLECGEVTDSLK